MNRAERRELAKRQRVGKGQDKNTPVNSQHSVKRQRLETKVSSKPVVTIYGVDYEIYSYTQQNFVDIVAAVMNPETGEAELADFNTLSNAAETIARQIIPTIGTDVIDTTPRGDFIFTIQSASKLLVFLSSIAAAYYTHFASDEERKEIEFDLVAIESELAQAEQEFN